MEQPDPDLYKWVSGEALPPGDVDAAFLARIRAFHTRTDDHAWLRPIAGRALQPQAILSAGRQRRLAPLTELSGVIKLLQQ